MAKILITGGSGMIGKRLTELLLQKRYEVNLLGRAGVKKQLPGTKFFAWDIEKGEIDEAAFEGVSAIIHLAGAGIAEKRWTDKRKKEIMDSRVKSAGLIYNFLKKGGHNVKTFISTSASGYYGDTGDKILTETEPPGNNFLSEVCVKWEQGAINIGALSLRDVRLRTGIVLSKKGGALPQLMQTMALGFAEYFAKTPLYYPWIHLDDECGAILHAIENEEMRGVYNSVAPQMLQMKELMQVVIAAKPSAALLLPVPPALIKLALGEMSETVLVSNRCSAEKILATGFTFKYAGIKEALENIFNH